jgi:hypothetical protein
MIHVLLCQHSIHLVARGGADGLSLCAFPKTLVKLLGKTRLSSIDIRDFFLRIGQLAPSRKLVGRHHALSHKPSTSSRQLRASRARDGTPHRRDHQRMSVLLSRVSGLT